MPLSKSSLKSALKAAFEKQLTATSGPTLVPNITPALAADLGKAYHDYASDAKIGAAKLSSKGTASAVAGALTGNDYFDGWEAGTKAWWDAASADSGNGVYITGAKPKSAGLLGVKADIRKLLPKPAGDLEDPPATELDDFCGKLADVLNKFTTKIEVPTDDDNSAKSSGPTPTSPVPKVS